MKNRNILLYLSLSVTIILIALFSYSCGNKQADRNVTEHMDTVPQKVDYVDTTETIKDTIPSQNPVKLYKDTTITYDIFDISSEGAGVVVKYVQGDIRHAEIRVYGESGQSRTDYIFSDGEIEVIDTVFQYNKSITEVRSLSEDADIESASKYTLNYNGKKIKPQGDTIPDELFETIKEKIPFTLYAK